MYYESTFINEEENLLGKIFLWPFLILLAIFVPLVRIWFLLGILTVIWDMVKGKQKEGSWRNYFTKELVFGLNPFSNCLSIWHIILLWPVEAVRLAISGEPQSYQTDFRLEKFSEYRRDPQNYGMHLDTMGDFVKEDIEARKNQGIRAAEKISEIYVKGRKPVAATVLASAIALNPCIAQTKEKKSITGQMEIFSDWSLERQLWLRLNAGPWILHSQNRLSADSQSFFSHLGLGRGFQLSQNIQTILVFGPQYTKPVNKIDRVVGFINFTVRNSGLNVVAVNRLSWGLNSKTPFIHKHVQNIGTSLIPWLRLRAEELRSKGKWLEFQIGPEIHLFQCFKFWPYYDFARHTPDVKIHLTLNF